jgi:hypothetical protein
MWPRQPHLQAISFLLAASLVLAGVWVVVQNQRDEPLPTLVWAGEVSDAQMLAQAPWILNRLAPGWWWLETTPAQRTVLRTQGVALAVALPTPLFRMAGCTSNMPRKIEGLQP